MTPEALRAACLALDGASEAFPFPRYPERSVFKVAGAEPLTGRRPRPQPTASTSSSPRLATSLPMISRWTSEVPSQMRSTRMSR